MPRSLSEIRIVPIMKPSLLLFINCGIETVVIDDKKTILTPEKKPTFV
jgi:hypothetical protein